MLSEPVSRFLQGLNTAETRRAYRYDLRCFFAFLADRDGPPDPIDVSPDDVRRYVRELKAASLSVSTKRRRVAAVRRFYEWLRTEEGAISFTPVQCSPSFASENRDAEASTPGLDREALATLLEHIDRGTLRGQRDYTLLLVIVYGALRRAEVAALDVDDVRPLGRHWVIDLPVSSQPQGGYVKIPAAVADHVQRLADRYDESEGPLWRSLGPRHRGGRLSPDALYKIVRRAGRAAGIEALSIDGLRRAGLQLASIGGATLSELRDHARLTTTSSTAKYTATPDTAGRLSSSVSDRIPLTLE